jgi:hypothetical protein
MDPWAVLVRSKRALLSTASALLDPLPPYRWIEGRLDTKEERPAGHFLLVDGEIVEVDWLTFQTLSEGEALRVRCTRSNKAISIDRLVP